MPCIPFPSLIKTIQSEVKHIPEISKKLQKARTLQFSTDLALVGASIRTAYLVDVIVPHDPVIFWEDLLQRLRSNPQTQTMFALIMHVFEPSSAQSFIVNVPLLSHRVRIMSGTFDHDHVSNLKDKGSDKYPIFVSLCRGFQVLHSPSPLISQLISFLRIPSPTPLSHILHPIPPTLSVPLAAILLDYGVAYIPDSDASGLGSDTLSGVPVDFYKCQLNFFDEDEFLRSDQNPKIRQCTVMAFSCPATLRETIDSVGCQKGCECDHSLKPIQMLNYLDDLFAQRLQSINDPTLLRVDVQRTTNTLDRLTF